MLVASPFYQVLSLESSSTVDLAVIQYAFYLVFFFAVNKRGWGLIVMVALAGEGVIHCRLEEVNMKDRVDALQCI